MKLFHSFRCTWKSLTEEINQKKKSINQSSFQLSYCVRCKDMSNFKLLIFPQFFFRLYKVHANVLQKERNPCMVNILLDLFYCSNKFFNFLFRYAVLRFHNKKLWKANKAIGSSYDQTLVYDIPYTNKYEFMQTSKCQ